MTRGIENIRALYPDIAFRVLDVCACSSGDKVGMVQLLSVWRVCACMHECAWQHAQVFVHWSMSGTAEGERAETSGISLMSFDGEGRIAETQVYRQALPAEVRRAQQRGSAVPQGALLDT